MIMPKGVAAGVTCASANPTFTYQYTTNAFGDILTTTDPLNHQSSRVYDKNRNVTSATDLDGNQTGYGYNFDSELITTTRADTTTLQSDYWGDGTLKSQTDGANQTTNYTYDALAHLASVTDPLNRTTSYAADAVGNVVAKQDPGGNCGAVPKVGCTTFGYDKANQLVSTTYSDGVTPNVTYAYDADGQRTSMTDGTGASTWQYDSLHRLTSYKNGANATVGYGYDLRNNVTSIVYPSSTGTVTRGYDDAGRLRSVTDWASHQTTFDYDADSFLTTQTYPNTTTGTYTPDNADRLTGITDKKSGTTFASFNYVLDNAAQVTAVSSSGVPPDNHTYSYNQLNQLKTVDAQSYAYDPADNPTVLGATGQTFDTANEVTASAPRISLVGTASGGNSGSPNSVPITLPSGTAAGDLILVAATLQRSKSVTTPTGYTQISGSPFQSGTANTSAKVAIFSKIAAAADSSVTVQFGGGTDKAVTVATYRGVDAAAPLDGTAIAGVAAPGSSVTIPSLTTTVANDRLVTFLAATGASGSPSWTAPFGMTKTVEKVGGGSVGADADQSLGAAGPTGTRIATFSQSTQLVGVNLALKPSATAGSSTYGYDTRGNRTSATPSGGPALSYGYDQANRLKNYNNGAATYAYNGDGLRMSKTVGATTTQQTWDPTSGLPLMLVDGTTSYVYGPDGLPLEQINGSTVTYFHHDQLGSTRALSDASGNTVATYTYDVYGKQTASTGSATNPFGFAGQYTDAESGLQYLRARYYDPTTAQFLTRDPALSLTRSAYTYSDNAPTNFSDPSGLDCSISPWEWGDCIEEASDATTDFLVEHRHAVVDIGIGAVAAGGIIACGVTVVCGVVVVGGAVVGGTAVHLGIDAVLDDPGNNFNFFQAVGHSVISAGVGGACGLILEVACLKALEAGGTRAVGGVLLMGFGFASKWLIDRLADLADFEC